MSTGDSVGQIGLYLALLVVLFALGAWLLRGGLGALHGGMKGERLLHIRETRGLGARQFLVVAEYDGRRMLLGVCPGRIEYLTGLSPRDGGDEAFASVLKEKVE